MKTKKTAGRIALDILSIFFVVVFLAPVIWALFVSLQHEGKQISSIVSWFTPPYTISNYSDIIKNSSVPLWFMNSLFIAVIVTVATVLVTGMAAYALALIPFKGSQLFMIYVLIGMMVPGEATIVPLFITVKDLKLIDSYAGMILPSIAGSMNLIIMTTFFKGLPRELIEATEIDGGGKLTVFFKIVMPLSKSIIATICIFSFVGSWNNYLWPLLCAMSNEMFTLPVGIPTFTSTYTVDYVKPMTASMVASLPMIILYIIFERQIVAGITQGAVKGRVSYGKKGKKSGNRYYEGASDPGYDPLPLSSVLRKRGRRYREDPGKCDQPHDFFRFPVLFWLCVLSGLFSGGHKAWNRPYASEYDQASAGVLYFRSRLYGI